MSIQEDVIKSDVIPAHRFKKGRDDVKIISGERGGVEFRTKVRSVNDPLQWYSKNGFITLMQRRAGKKLYSLWYFGFEQGNCSTSRYGEMRGEKYDRDALQQEYLDARNAIRAHNERHTAFRVCCMGEFAGRMGNQSGTEYLVSALDDLIRHFGFES